MAKKKTIIERKKIAPVKKKRKLSEEAREKMMTSILLRVSNNGLNTQKIWF